MAGWPDVRGRFVIVERFALVAGGAPGRAGLCQHMHEARPAARWPFPDGASQSALVPGTPGAASAAQLTAAHTAALPLQ